MERRFKHLPHYVSLISIFVAGVIGFIVFSYDRQFQIAVSLALALSYISWGVIHHTLHKDICLTIILEYIAVAILGFVMLFSLIYRA